MYDWKLNAYYACGPYAKHRSNYMYMTGNISAHILMKFEGIFESIWNKT